MIIDAHVHLLPDRVRRELAAVCAADPWFGACHSRSSPATESAEGLVEAMDGSNIDRALCFTWPFVDPALCAEANDYLAAAVRSHPDRLIGFGCVQPLDPGAVAEVRRCAQLGLRGLGELNADAQGWVLEDDALLAPLAEASVEAGLPWTLHCSEPLGHDYPGKGTATPGRVAQLAERHPELTLVCAHLGGGLPLFAHMPEVLELCRRLYFDTAAVPFLYRPSVYEACIALVGADRVLFGSDYPLLPASRYVDTIRELPVSEADRAAILGGNAARLLSLE